MAPSILTVLSTAFMLSGLSRSATAASCSCLSDAVSSISADASGAAFCSQYISTIWDVTTITTPIATTIITDTVSALLTITTTVLELGSTTTTLTETVSIPYVSTATAVVTSPTTVCYSGTSYGLANATPAPTAALEQRQVISGTLQNLALPTPPSIISVEDSLVSSACECFLGSSATVTETLTDFVGSGTLTATVDFTTIPTKTAYISLVTTWTDVAVTTASTATSTTTTTSTSYTPVPTNTDLGLNWYYYTSPYAFQGAIKFSVDYFNSPDYNFSGYIQNVGDFHTGTTYSTTSTNYTCYIPAGEDCGYVGIIFQGYLWAAHGAGNYTLSSGDGSDNAFLVWHGPNAYDNYQNSNYDYQANYPSTSGSVTISVGSEELVPVTMLWLNGGGPGRALLSITSPAGTTYTDSAGFFVPANTSCSGYSDPFSP